MTLALAPKLSALDPEQPSEGSIDPLGVYAIADRLGTRLVPGVRERMVCPRFLTVIAIGRELTRGFGPDEMAKDGVSSPEMVFEWVVLEGLVRSGALALHQHGVPGNAKTRRVLDGGGRLSARSYLKSARVMGFHGIYRTLARELGVIDDELGDLGEFGQQLVAVWEREQHLPGFSGEGRDGAGQQVRRIFDRAIRAGLDAGGVVETRATAWDAVRQHLAPGTLPAGEEAHHLREALLADSSGFRGTVLRFLVSPEGATLARSRGAAWERRVHEKLALAASGRQSALLAAIETYETFARLLETAFEDMLFHLSERRRPVSAHEFGEIPSVRAAAERISTAFEHAAAALESLGEYEGTAEVDAFRASFEMVATPGPPSDFAVQLLDHHRRVQEGKPPNGKSPWFWDDAHGFEVRPAYYRDVGGPDDDRYVHGYRSGPLANFAGDLGMLP